MRTGVESRSARKPRRTSQASAQMRPTASANAAAISAGSAPLPAKDDTLEATRTADALSGPIDSTRLVPSAA